VNIESYVASDRTQAINLDIVQTNLRMLKSSESFATSMLDQLADRGVLSLKQWMWMDILAQRVIDKAQNYGHKTGKCTFCRRRLTDERSVIVGYGPTCAENNHLPWG